MMGTINFHLRKSTSSKKRPGRVFARFIHKGESRSFTLPYSLRPDEWDERNRRIIITKGSPRAAVLKEISAALEKEESRAELLLMEMERKGTYTVDGLKEAFVGGAEKSTLKGYTEKLAYEKEQSGKDRTPRAYRGAVRRFIGFIGNDGIKLDELTSVLIIAFERFLFGEGLSRNTVAFYMSVLRAIYNKALAEKLFIPRETDIFRDVCTTGEKAKEHALSTAEVGKAYKLEVSSPGLRKALLIFLFSFFARGIPFVDLFYLRKEDIRDGILYYTRRKTGQALAVKVTEEMRSILGLLEGETDGSPRLLPLAPALGTPSYRDYGSALRLQNRRLGKIGEMCGLERRLSTHVARHSWATAAKAAGFPIAVISECLGHTSVKTTSIYLAAFDRAVLDKANEEVSRMVIDAAA